MHHKVLIVGTVPYNKNTSSRAFDAYFHNWEKENIRQIFSNPKTPVKGHCGSLYQITDAMLLKRRIKRSGIVGKIFNYDTLPDDWENLNDLEVESKRISRFYKWGRKKTSINRLIRGWLWKDKFWNTEMLRSWLNDFKPECVFLAFSDDFFINKIALYVADMFNIPIMCCIGDDYYFNNKFSFDPFYHIYRYHYKKLIRKVFSHKCSAIYISDKIRNKYNKEFHINGDTVYLISEIERKKFIPINVDEPIITYCGNVRMGRYKSLILLAKALQNISNEYRIIIYSNENDKKILKKFNECAGISFKGRIPYSQVIQEFKNSDIVVIPEGFSKKDINFSRYSLSTKAADSISSGCQIITIGSTECGVIEYMKKVDCSLVICDTNEVLEKINSFINNIEMQRYFYERSNIALLNNHNLKRSNEVSEQLFNDLIEGFSNEQ